MPLASVPNGTLRKKISTRRYGVPHSDASVFLELKKKCEGVLCKRRVTVSQSYEGLEGSTVTVSGGMGGMGGSGAGRPDGMGFSPDQRQAPQKLG